MGTQPRDPGLSELQESRRINPLLGLIAQGSVPVAGHENAVGRAMERIWEREMDRGVDTET